MKKKLNVEFVDQKFGGTSLPLLFGNLFVNFFLPLIGVNLISSLMENIRKIVIDGFPVLVGFELADIQLYFTQTW